MAEKTVVGKMFYYPNQTSESEIKKYTADLSVPGTQPQPLYLVTPLGQVFKVHDDRQIPLGNDIGTIIERMQEEETRSSGRTVKIVVGPEKRYTELEGIFKSLGIEYDAYHLDYDTIRQGLQRSNARQNTPPLNLETAKKEFGNLITAMEKNKH